MPILTHHQIVRITDVMMRAGGASAGHAGIVADHLANANLAGYDSHGLIRIPQYLTNIEDEELDPRAEPEVVGSHGGIIQIDGHSTFGQVVAARATEMAIEKARDHGLSLVTMGNHTNTGRVGTYPEMAAAAGMAAIMFGGLAGGPYSTLAPFGGREARLGTNPLAMAFPHAEGAPILLDFASSMANDGKLRVYRNKEQDLPDAWIIDKHGVPSRNPDDFFDGGAHLPVGGSQGGHKGYALSVMIALFGGLLGQIACPVRKPASLTGTVPERIDLWAGSTILVIDIGRMAPVENIRTEVQEMMRYLQNTPLMDGSTGVLFPGERSANNRKERLAKGIPVDQTTWGQVEELFDRYGVRDQLVDVVPSTESKPPA